MLKLIHAIAVSAVFITAAQARELTDAEWREDINAAVAAIRENHPSPFHAVKKEEFDEMTAALVTDLPALSDKDATLRLAALVALLEDGHTRLSLPRAHPKLAFNPAHTGPDEQAHEALTFSTLPFRFYLFEDGLHIIEATAGFEQYMGAKVVSFGEASADDAAAAVRPILYVENDMGAKLVSADRLALPDVLKHFGLIDSTESVSLTLELNGTTETLVVSPIAAGAKIEISTPTFDSRPLALRYPEELKWHARVPDERAWYIKVDEIEMFPERLLSDFMADALRQAKRARANRILLDLRDNHGGTASFNASIINAISQSDYNDYGETFVLVGRETLSAASMLMGEFEKYTNAIFVGEPSGAKPSTFGDPRRVQLPNSGLTLRVSTISWHSWLAGEFRPFIETHIDAPPTAAAYFAGRDPVIEAALDYTPPQGPAAQMAELFEKDKLQSGLLRFFSWLNSPIDGQHDAVDDLIAYGHNYLDDGELQKGRFMMAMARDYYPTNAEARAGLGRAMELNGDPESAQQRYLEALELDPDNAAAKEGVARLAIEE